MTAGIERGQRPHQIVGYECVPPSVCINGGFGVWERGTSFTMSGGSNQQVTADEWQVNRASSITDIAVVTRQTVQADGRDYALQLVGTTGPGGNIVVTQGLEMYQSLQGNWITFSIDLWCDTADLVRANVAFSSVSQGHKQYDHASHPGGSVWERQTVTVLLPDDLTPTGDPDWPHDFAIRIKVNMDDDCTLRMTNAMCVLGYYPEGVPFIPKLGGVDVHDACRFYERGTGSLVGYNQNVSLGDGPMSPINFRSPKYSSPTITFSNTGFLRSNSVTNVIASDLNGFTPRMNYIAGSAGGAYATFDWEAETT